MANERSANDMHREARGWESELADAERSEFHAELAIRDQQISDLEVERDELLNERKVYRSGIAAHRVALLSRDWGTSAKAADETLWRLLDDR